MSKLKMIAGKVVKFSDIPKHLSEGSWFSHYTRGCYVECHIDSIEINDDEISKWLIDTYPSIENETFYIEIDY